MILEDKNTN